MRKDKTCQKLKLSMYLENPILLENSSLSLPRELGPGQSGEEEVRLALFKAEEDWDKGHLSEVNIDSLGVLMVYLQGCWAGWPMSLQGYHLLSLKDHGNQISSLSLQKGKQNTWVFKKKGEKDPGNCISVLNLWKDHGVNYPGSHDQP